MISAGERPRSFHTASAVSSYTRRRNSRPVNSRFRVDSGTSRLAVAYGRFRPKAALRLIPNSGWDQAVFGIHATSGYP